jgi:hypothetical protein
MAKVTITPLTTLSNSLSAVNTINTNFSRIATALEKTLSRDGTAPNNMTADIDLNNNDLLNVGYVQANDIMVGGVTLTDRLDYIIEVGENVANADLQIAQFVNEAKVAKDASQAAAQVSIDAATDAVEAVLSIGTSVEDAEDAAIASAASAVQSAGSATASAGSATAAQGSATAASGSATAAAGSASAASTSATNAAAQVTLAANQVALATTQAGNAATSATNASNSATTAQGHAEDAADQVDYAQEWAQNPQDVPVSVEAGGDGATTFSALHWAMEAAEAVGFDPALYYTKVEVDSLIDGVEVDLSDYYTKTQVDTALGTKVTAAMNNIIPGTGITGGGNLANPVVIGLAPTTVTSLGKADTALQPAAIGDTVQAQSDNLDLLSLLTLAGNSGFVIGVNSTGDGFELVPQSGGGGKLELVHQDIITTSAPYTVWADAEPDDEVHVEMWSGGAGGGAVAGGNGGFGGTYTSLKFYRKELGDSFPATVGAGGSAASSGAVNGGLGGGTHIMLAKYSIPPTPAGNASVPLASYFGALSAVFQQIALTASPIAMANVILEPRLIFYDVPFNFNSGAGLIPSTSTAKTTASYHGGVGGGAIAGPGGLGQLSALGGSGGDGGQISGAKGQNGQIPGGGGGAGFAADGGTGARGEIRVSYYRSV